MDQYRDLGMREYLDRLAAEDERGDAVAAVRGHDDEVTAFRHRGIDDQSIFATEITWLSAVRDCLRCGPIRVRFFWFLRRIWLKGRRFCGGACGPKLVRSSSVA